jgi:hypothetical protein
MWQQRSGPFSIKSDLAEVGLMQETPRQKLTVGALQCLSLSVLVFLFCASPLNVNDIAFTDNRASWWVGRLGSIASPLLELSTCISVPPTRLLTQGLPTTNITSRIQPETTARLLRCTISTPRMYGFTSSAFQPSFGECRSNPYGACSDFRWRCHRRNHIGPPT